LQEQLRHLSRQLLLAQEEERKRISRELHDEIAQTLTGINVRLAALKTEATHNTKGLQNKIASTQRMVEKSVDIVHRFARELRPTVLDDLGLIPALHSFVKSFSKQTRIHVGLTVYAAVEQLDSVKRTVLYRVAQEALTNVARHAHASRVDLSIEKLPRTVCLTIQDNGKSFQVERCCTPKGTNDWDCSACANGWRWSAAALVSNPHRAKARPSAPDSIHERQREVMFMKRITVLLAEDHMIVREGFRKLLGAEADLEVVGEAQTGRQAVEMTRKAAPRGGRDGHRDAAAQWVGSHAANSQGLSGHQGAHALRAQR
jgi:two-component sensor histidine kinase